MSYAVLTRDPADAQAYVAALAPLGLEVVAMPVTRTAPAADPQALARALASGGFAAIVIASPRAAHELAKAERERASGFGLRASGPETETGPEIWAVGAATKRALEIAGLRAQLAPGARDGAELAQYLVKARALGGKRVLVPRAEEGRVEPREILRAAGAEVVDVIAYRTLSAAPDDELVRRGAELLGSGQAAICAVFAPSQVAALREVLAVRGVALSAVETRFCAIGETTASALRAAGVTKIAVAPAPTPEGIAHAVGSVYPPLR